MIHRIRPTDNFTLIHNEPLRDESLSWKAKGLLAYLMSLPDDWKVSITDLSNRSKEGRSATTSAMDELIAAGYAKSVTKRGDGGMFDGIDYIVSSVKFSDHEKPVADKPQAEDCEAEPLCENLKAVDEPLCDFPLTDNRQLPITNNNKNELYFKENILQDNDFKEKEINKEKESEFRNSGVFDMAVFRERLSKEAGMGIDIDYYHKALLDWNDSLRSINKKKYRSDRGWIATARTIMRNDQDKKKLKMIKKDNSLLLEYMKL